MQAISNEDGGYSANKSVVKENVTLIKLFSALRASGIAGFGGEQCVDCDRRMLQPGCHFLAFRCLKPGRIVAIGDRRRYRLVVLVHAVPGGAWEYMEA